MADETDPNQPAEVAADADSIKRMKKVLGYYVSEEQQETPPGEREASAEEQPAETQEETPAAGEPATGQSEESSEAGSAETSPEKGEQESETETPAVTEEEQKSTPRSRKVERKEPVTKDDLQKVLSEVLDKKQAKKPDAPAAEAAAPDDESDLIDAERKSLELARLAAEAMPEKYKDMVQREKAWIKKNREFVAKLIEDNDGEFDPASQEYQDFVRKHRPQYKPGDREELFIKQAAKMAVTETEKKFQTALAERDRLINEMRFAPAIEKAAAIANDAVASKMGDETALKLYKEDPVKFAEEYPLEAPIVSAWAQATKSAVATYLSLAKGIVEFDKTNPAHNDIINFIQKQGEVLDAMPESKRIRDGKLLVSRSKFNQMVRQGQDVSNFDTFTDGDVIGMVVNNASAIVADGITKERERVKKVAKRLLPESSAAPAQKTETVSEPTGESSTAEKSAPPAKPAPAPDKKVVPPKTVVSRSPGAKPPATPAAPKTPVSKVLGYTMPKAED